MSRNAINVYVQRKLYAESMGRCMNPNCKNELFRLNGDVIEKAHIDPYCKTADNSFDNLIVLCPTCHTDFDQNSAFSPEEVRSWKTIRQNELQNFFSKKLNSFDELKNEVKPLLLENKNIFEKYYLGNCKELWEVFENIILINNNKLKLLFEKNFDLFQTNNTKAYSNLAYIQDFILHAEEFAQTRLEKDKIRKVLFPQEINSMFGISPINSYLIPSTESLEFLITKLNEEGKYKGITIGIDSSYIQILENGTVTRVYLNDTPRIRQLYYDYKCFKNSKVRLESLIFALTYLKNNGINYSFLNFNNLREISINDTKLVFVYEYCLSKINLIELCPEEKSVIVNLHNWNGDGCISNEAYEFSEKININLLTMEKFYEYVRKIKRKG